MAEKEQTKSVFDVLNAIDVNGYTEKKNGLTYLSWSYAWTEVKKRYPDATYTIYKDDQQRPFMEDPDFGLMCYTSVTIEGQTYEMWLPVMDSANNAMRRTPYSYQVWNKAGKCWDEKRVAAATMFDINKSIMRCLVKNLAMFGLGLYIYSGEDLPEAVVEEQKANIMQQATSDIASATSVDALLQIWQKYPSLQGDKQYRDIWVTKRGELEKK